MPMKTMRRYSGYRMTQIKKWSPLFLMMAPGLIYLTINNYIPLFGLFIAFKRVNFKLGLWESLICSLYRRQ